jgi:dienelactone hydrolase
MGAAGYDPFSPGRFGVGVRTIQARDAARGRVFPVEIWYPAGTRPAGPAAGQDAERGAAAHPGTSPLIVFSHYSGGHRRTATFLCTHLASHGYAVAAMDHSEVVAPELARRDGETSVERATRIDAVIASRVPDVRFLLGYLLAGGAGGGTGFDAEQVGLVGHSFGGWTVLAVPDAEPLVRAVVALAPGGSARPRPGILPLRLAFAWRHEVPALFLAAEQDTPVPLDGVQELLRRAPAPKRMFVLRRADHQHFVDDVEGEHEALRALPMPGDAAWIPAAMRPITELCTGEQAHIFARGLTLAHLDATLRRQEAADRFLAGDAESALAAHGVEAYAYPP